MMPLTAYLDLFAVLAIALAVGFAFYIDRFVRLTKQLQQNSVAMSIVLSEIMAILRYIAEKEAPLPKEAIPEKTIPPKVEPRDWTSADDSKDKPFIRLAPQWIEPKEAG